MLVYLNYGYSRASRILLLQFRGVWTCQTRGGWCLAVNLEAQTSPSPCVSTFCLFNITVYDQISQAFPLRIHILQAIKDWRWDGLRTRLGCRWRLFQGRCGHILNPLLMMECCICSCSVTLPAKFQPHPPLCRCSSSKQNGICATDGNYMYY